MVHHILLYTLFVIYDKCEINYELLCIKSEQFVVWYVPTF